MNAARKITDEITMRDIFSKYGFHPNRRGNICCPFHNEKNPSLGTYADGRRWKCFGCGEGGSVIDFVMKLFDVDFKTAVARIDADFCIGLFKKPTLTQYKIMQHRERERRNMLAKEKEKHRSAEQAYWNAFDEWKRLDDNKRDYAPKSLDEEWHPLFIEALRKIDYAEYLLEIAEIEREQYD